MNYEHEGLTLDAGRILVVNELTWSVVELDSTGGCTSHEVYPQGKPLGFQGKENENSGPEGIAVGTDYTGQRRAFIAKERSPRLLIELDPESWTPIRTIDFEDDSLSRVEGWNGPPLPVSCDFADLSLSEGYLYALLRNSWAILKIDPVTGREIARLRFPPVERDLFDLKEPYGIFEGLWIDDEGIWLIADNGQTHRRGEPSNKSSVLIQLAHPEGF